MKKKIAILGSTGSIGKTLIDIIDKDKKDFKIILLTAQYNYKRILKQAKQFNVSNIIITDEKFFKIAKKKNSNNKLKIYNNFDNLDKIFKKKIDFTMSAISGIKGLKPTVNSIKYTKKIAIANKESIICGWNIIKKELKKNKTEFIPVDSEHFSLWYGLRGLKVSSIDKVFLTASGGPFYKIPLAKFKKIKISQALKHPNWKMGKKISVDSATLINKIYEVVEAKNIFDIPYKKIEILIHPKSYIHAMLKFNNGLIKIIAHDTTMTVPIFNTLFFNTEKKLESKNVNLKILNNLSFKNVSPKRYPIIKILDLLPDKHSLYETVIVSTNDTLVDLFLNQKIKFIDIFKYLFLIIKMKEFLKYRKLYPKKINDIIQLNNYVRSKVLKKVYKSSNVKNSV